MFAWFAAKMNNYFRNTVRAARACWEYRIRYSQEKCAWVIELNESDGEDWKALAHRSEQTDYELHVRKFPSYQEARAHVLSTGLHYAYEEVQFGKNLTDSATATQTASARSYGDLDDALDRTRTSGNALAFGLLRKSAQASKS